MRMPLQEILNLLHQAPLRLLGSCVPQARGVRLCRFLGEFESSSRWFGSALLRSADLCSHGRLGCSDALLGKSTDDCAHAHWSTTLMARCRPVEAAASE